MKKSVTSLFVTVLFLGFFFTSCNGKELDNKAAETATAFYQDFQKKDYKKAISHCSEKAFTTDSKASWMKSLETNNVLLGELKSFTKTSGFNIEASTSMGTTVTLTYDVVFEYGTSKDSLVCVKEKDGSMKIFKYAWKHFDAKYVKETRESEQQADLYMQAVKAGNYDAAINLCSADALKSTPKADWKAFLEKASDKLGGITNYNILKDSSYYNILAKGESGEGNYYDIYIKSNRNGNDVMEKIIFFQKDYTMPVKLVGHIFL